jgi:hypothetical protein
MASGEPQPARDMFVQGQPARQLGERPSTGVLRDHAALLCDARDPVRVGRDFADSDTRESPPVAIVNEALATDYRDGRKSACFAVARRRISLALGPTRSTHRPARSARGPDIQRPHSPSDRRGRRTLVVRSIHDGAAVLVPLILFVAAVIYHSRIRRARSRTDRGAAHYRVGLARIEDRWSGLGNPGTSLEDANHVYAADLDVFGPGNLFELLCA